MLPSEAYAASSASYRCLENRVLITNEVFFASMHSGFDSNES